MTKIKPKETNKFEQIIELIYDYSDFDIDINGYHDYSVIPYLTESSKKTVIEHIKKILEA